MTTRGTGVDVTLTLTDDEIVALSARAGQPWPSPVPTVRVTDEEAVSTAAQRGARSLIARRLLGTEGRDTLDSSLRLFVEPIFGGGMTLGSYLSDDAYGYQPGGLCSGAYIAQGTDLVTEMVTPVGLHLLSFAAPHEHYDFLRRIMAQAHAAGRGAAGLNVSDSLPSDLPFSCVFRLLEGGRTKFVLCGPEWVRGRSTDAQGEISEPAMTLADAFRYLEISEGP